MAQILFFHGTIEDNRAFLTDLKKLQNLTLDEFSKMTDKGAAAFGTTSDDTISVGSNDTWLSNGRSYQISFDDITYFYAAFFMAGKPQDNPFDDTKFNKKGDRNRTYNKLTEVAIQRGYISFMDAVKFELKVLNAHFRRLKKLGV